MDIECQPNETGTLTIWFRVLDNAGMEFIASFSNGVKKDTESNPSSTFTYGKIRSHKVTLVEFSRERDSGLYGCSSLIKGKELRFGPLTRLFGGEFADSGLGGDTREASEPTQVFLSSERVKPKPTVAQTTPSRHPATSAPACACNSKEDSSECFRSASTCPTSPKHAFFQGESALCSSASRSSWARWSAAVAFFFYSSSSPLCTATVSGLQSSQ